MKQSCDQSCQYTPESCQLLHKPLQGPWDEPALPLYEDKESSGYSQSPLAMKSSKGWSEENCQLASPGAEDNLKEEKPPGMNITKLSLRSARRKLFPGSKACLEEESMENLPSRPKRKSTAPKRLPVLENLSNMEPNPFVETPRSSGSPYGPPPSPEISTPSLQMLEWLIITPSERSTQIMQCLDLLLEKSKYSGVLQELVNHTVHGVKQDSVLTLNAQGPNSGMVTKLKQMLSLMNFGAVSTSHTSSDGQIVTQFVWKSKDLPDPLMLKEYGLHQIWTQEAGIPSWM